MGVYPGDRDTPTSVCIIDDQGECIDFLEFTYLMLAPRSLSVADSEKRLQDISNLKSVVLGCLYCVSRRCRALLLAHEPYAVALAAFDVVCLVRSAVIPSHLRTIQQAKHFETLFVKFTNGGGGHDELMDLEPRLSRELETLIVTMVDPALANVWSTIRSIEHAIITAFVGVSRLAARKQGVSEPFIQHAVCSCGGTTAAPARDRMGCRRGQRGRVYRHQGAPATGTMYMILFPYLAIISFYAGHAEQGAAARESLPRDCHRDQPTRRRCQRRCSARPLRACAAVCCWVWAT